jgi:hypothetical protein
MSIEKLDYKIFRVKNSNKKVSFSDGFNLVSKRDLIKREFLLFDANSDLMHKSVYYRFNLLSLQLLFFNYGVIGNCWTDESIRGQGIYGKMIDYILNDVKRSCILFVDIENEPSVRGIKRIGGEEIYHYKIYRFFRVFAFFFKA